MGKTRELFKKIRDTKGTFHAKMGKIKYFGHLMRRTDSLEKDPDAAKDLRQEETGTTEDEMVGWHHQLYGREFE